MEFSRNADALLRQAPAASVDEMPPPATVTGAKGKLTNEEFLRLCREVIATRTRSLETTGPEEKPQMQTEKKMFQPPPDSQGRTPALIRSAPRQREITADLVHRAEQMLRVGINVPRIASRLGVTQYVVRVIAGDDECRDGSPSPQRAVRRRVPNSTPSIDPATIRMIQRMLAVGMLTHVQIAREAGVSPNTVTDVASGNRPAVAVWSPCLRRGERFVPEAIRCSVCRAMISVVPCRACEATRHALAEKSV